MLESEHNILYLELNVSMLILTGLSVCLKNGLYLVYKIYQDIDQGILDVKALYPPSPKMCCFMTLELKKPVLKISWTTCGYK